MMNIQYYFPTAIAIEKNISMAELMLPIAKKYLDDKSRLTYAWGYKNTFTPEGAGLEELPDIKPFVDFIHAKGREFLFENGYDADKLDFSTQIFVSEMTAGDQHALHTHPNSLLSGLLYLEVPDGSSPIVFSDPRPFRSMVALPKKGEAVPNWEQVYFQPESGTFMIWESWLAHEVPKNHSEQGRITMVFNLGKISK
jgi:uncharacterized protein (TIGR02466 family)